MFDPRRVAQSWKFSLQEQAITLWPDPSRRCPAVDLDDLHLLEQAASGGSVQLVQLTEKSALEKAPEFIVQGNSVQMRDKAFVEALSSWIHVAFVHDDRAAQP